MKRMFGATATTTGGYDTHTYTMNYIPKNGGPPVVNLKRDIDIKIQPSR